MFNLFLTNAFSPIILIISDFKISSSVINFLADSSAIKTGTPKDEKYLIAVVFPLPITPVKPILIILKLLFEFDQYLGFLDIADDYSSTKAGKLANYYAGLSYLYLKEYESAIEYLEDFESDDIILSSLAIGCIGDAYMELGDTDAALDAYADAVNNSDNDFTAPRYIMKQAMIYSTNGDNNKALDLFKEIQSNYKNSPEANGIEKYIARAENS